MPTSLSPPPSHFSRSNQPKKDASGHLPGAHCAGCRFAHGPPSAAGRGGPANLADLFARQNKSDTSSSRGSSRPSSGSHTSSSSQRTLTSRGPDLNASSPIFPPLTSPRTADSSRGPPLHKFSPRKPSPLNPSRLNTPPLNPSSRNSASSNASSFNPLPPVPSLPNFAPRYASSPISSPPTSLPTISSSRTSLPRTSSSRTSSPRTSSSRTSSSRTSPSRSSSSRSGADKPTKIPRRGGEVFAHVPSSDKGDMLVVTSVSVIPLASTHSSMPSTSWRPENYCRPTAFTTVTRVRGTEQRATEEAVSRLALSGGGTSRDQPAKQLMQPSRSNASWERA